MSKITLGKTPKVFAPATVTFKMPGGEEATLQCVFKYRTRRQFGDFIRDTFAAPAGEQTDISQIIARSVDISGEYLLAVLESWSLDEPLNLNTATQLADEVPAAVGAFMTAYRNAVMDGHLGN